LTTPRVIALVGQKGGGGKTTLAVNLATHWHRAGARVLLVDTDPQASAITWASVAQERGTATPGHVVALGDNIRVALGAMARGYDYVVIDTAGRESRRAAAALLLSDLSIVPVRPEPLDVWTLGATLQALDDVRSVRPDCDLRGVLNVVPPRSVLAQRARESLADSGILSLSTEVRQSCAFGKASAVGDGVDADSAPGLDIIQLALEIEMIIVGKGVRRAS
jgi:chromosome partitioning protein